MSEPLPMGPLLRPGSWTPGIRAELDAMIRQYGRAASEFDPTSPPVAALDFDETCLGGDISHALLEVLAAEQPHRDWIGEYERGCQEDVALAYTTLVEWLLTGFDDHSIRTHTLTVLRSAIAEGELAIRTEMQDLIYWLQFFGWEVWVVTASPTAVVRNVAQHYGVPPNRVLGMEVQRSLDGAFLPEITGTVTYRQGKVDAIKAATGRAPIFAAGDSMTDYELLCSAQHGLLIERDPRMTAPAAKRGWWLQQGW